MTMKRFTNVSDLPRPLQELLPNFDTTPLTSGPFLYPTGLTVVYLHENLIKESNILGRMSVEYQDGFVRDASHPVDGVWYLTVDGFMHQSHVYPSRADLADAIRRHRV